MTALNTWRKRSNLSDWYSLLTGRHKNSVTKRMKYWLVLWNKTKIHIPFTILYSPEHEFPACTTDDTSHLFIFCSNIVMSDRLVHTLSSLIYKSPFARCHNYWFFTWIIPCTFRKLILAFYFTARAHQRFTGLITFLCLCLCSERFPWPSCDFCTAYYPISSVIEVVLGASFLWISFSQPQSLLFLFRSSFGCC